MLLHWCETAQFRRQVGELLTNAGLRMRSRFPSIQYLSVPLLINRSTLKLTETD